MLELQPLLFKKATSDRRGSNTILAENFFENHKFKPLPKEFESLGEQRTRLYVIGQNPIEIFSYLCELIQDFDPEPKISNHTWKLTFSGVLEEKNDEENQGSEEVKGAEVHLKPKA